MPTLYPKQEQAIHKTYTFQLRIASVRTRADTDIMIITAVAVSKSKHNIHVKIVNRIIIYVRCIYVGVSIKC